MFIFQESPVQGTSVLAPAPASASIPVPAQEQELTDRDITSVVDKLESADLSRLYVELNVTYTERGDAESQALTQGKLDKALAVFHKWQKKEGKAATKMALLRALKECRLKDAMQKMQKEWGIVFTPD